LGFCKNLVSPFEREYLYIILKVVIERRWPPPNPPPSPSPSLQVLLVFNCKGIYFGFFHLLFMMMIMFFWGVGESQFYWHIMVVEVVVACKWGSSKHKLHTFALLLLIISFTQITLLIHNIKIWGGRLCHFLNHPTIINWRK